MIRQATANEILEKQLAKVKEEKLPSLTKGLHVVFVNNDPSGRLLKRFTPNKVYEVHCDNEIYFLVDDNLHLVNLSDIGVSFLETNFEVEKVTIDEAIAITNVLLAMVLLKHKPYIIAKIFNGELKIIQKLNLKERVFIDIDGNAYHGVAPINDITGVTYIETALNELGLSSKYHLN